MLPATLLAALAAGLGAAPARAAWMLPPAPYRAKDFTIVKRDGWYHCFYIRSNSTVPFDSTERDLGHAISRDLYLWQHLPPVLPVRPGHWDEDKVWAPHIVEVDSVYYMFYTGVTNEPGTYAFHQRMGLATSTDLMTWNRLDAPILACADVPWTLCDTLQYTGGEFRDPFVMPHPIGDGWLLYYTTRPASDPDVFIVGVGVSNGDLAEWSDGKPLWITHRSWSGSPLAESPHLFQRGALWYLVFTGSAPQPLRLATSADPTGDPSSWTYRGTLAAMLGLDTRFWFASEFFQDGTHPYFAFVHFDRVDVREVVWGPDWTFSLAPPDLFHVHRMRWSQPEVAAGQPVNLVIEAVNTIGRHARFEVFEVDAWGAEQRIPNAAVGLPDSIPVPNLTTVHTWHAQTWPDPEEGDAAAEIVVRMADRTAATPPLRVLPPDLSPERVWDGSDGGRLKPREQVAFAQARPAAALRALARSPLGERALLLDLAAPARVRLDLFDLAGRRVRRLADRELPPGATVLAWDGRDDDGAPVTPGIYFARLSAPGVTRTARLLVAP